MKITKISTLTAALSASLLIGTSPAKADDAPAAPAASPAAPAATPATAAAPNTGGGGGANDWRQRMADRMKTMLKATDEEWTVIQPLLEKVAEKQRAARGGMGFGGGPGGPGGRRGGGNGGGNNDGGNGNGGNPPATPAAGSTPDGRPTPMPEAQALKTALDSDATTPDEIKAKLAALRDARKKATVELDQAREDLKKVLTLRQEAVLVNMGLLD